MAERQRRRSGRKVADLPHAALIADVVGGLLPIIDSPHPAESGRTFRLSFKLWALLYVDDAMPGPGRECGWLGCSTSSQLTRTKPDRSTTSSGPQGGRPNHSRRAEMATYPYSSHD